MEEGRHDPFDFGPQRKEVWHHMQRLIGWRLLAGASNWSLTDRRGLLAAGALWGLIAVLVAVLALAPLQAAVALVAAAIVIVLTLVRPAVGLAVLALAIPLGSAYDVGVGMAGLGAGETLGLLAVAAWLARMAAYRDVRIPRNRIWLPLGLLLGAMLLSVNGALSLGYSAKELAKWIEFAAVAICAASLPTPDERRLIVGASLLAGILAGLQGWYQFLFRVGPEGFLLMGRFMRAYGNFQQPNPFAGYLAIILPVALGIIIAYWPWGTGKRPADRILWILALGTFAVVGPAIVMTWSRGAWFGVMAGTLAIVIARGRSAMLVALVAGLALLGTVLITGADRYIPSSLTARLTDFTDYFRLRDVSDVKPNPTNWAVTERMAHWQAAVRMFTAHPWLGVGIGNYEPVYPAYRLARWPDALGHAHNYYLNIAAEAGLPGLATYLVFWTSVAWLALRAGFRNRGLWKGIALGALGAAAHLSVHNLFDNLYVQGIYLQVALWIGLIVPLQRQHGDEDRIDL